MTGRKTGLLLLVLGVSGAASLRDEPASTVPWGREGHEMAARAAATALPAELPYFFRASAAQLEYLNPEPDRWRERDVEVMDDAFEFDHYIDLENVPQGALDAPDRWEFLRALYAAGVERPEQRVGFLPYRIAELYERLVLEWRLWRNAPDRERPWIEARIVNDAGILGHYVTDASQPHHTTIHFNGWDANAPNPNGYSLERDFHARFESAFVARNVGFEDVLPHMSDGEPEIFEDVREAVWSYVRESNGEVERLYRLEQTYGFDPAAPVPETEAFAVERLVVGADMLRALWWNAWIESGRPRG